MDAYVVNVFDEVAGSELAIANAYRDLVVSGGGANLLIYLPLDATYGVTDQSTNLRNGTAAGGITIGGATGPGDGMPTATTFDGVDDRVTTTYSPFTNATIKTYEGWANRTNTLANHNLFSSDVAASAPVLQLSSGSQNVTWDPDNATAGGVVTWAAAWPGSAQWVHWMLVFDEGGDTVKLYINGSLVSSQAETQAYNATPGNIEWGIRGTTNAPFVGLQAHVAVYNTDKSSLAAAHAAAAPYAALGGNTSITVVDLADFNQDPEGGTAKVDDGTNNETITYTVPSGSTGSLNLSAPLSLNYLQGTKVSELVNGLPVVERWADLRQPDGEELLRARVPHYFRPMVAKGSRNEDVGEPEYVSAEIAPGGDLVVQDVLAETPKRLDLEATDGVSTDAINWYHPDGHRTARMRTLYTAGLPNAPTIQITANPDLTDNNVILLVNQDGVYVQVQDRIGGSYSRLILDYQGQSNFLLDDLWQDWTPTLTGWSANPTGNVYRYRKMGKVVVAVIRQTVSGTSNSVNTSITAPLTAATGTNYQWEAVAAGIDNGVLLTTPSRASINSGTSTITFGKDYSTNAGGWTAAGGKRIASCTIIYEAA